VAGMTQAHYLKGYFLLHYLLQNSESQESFFSLLQVQQHINILDYFIKNNVGLYKEISWRISELFPLH